MPESIWDYNNVEKLGQIEQLSILDLSQFPHLKILHITSARNLDGAEQLFSTTPSLQQLRVGHPVPRPRQRLQTMASPINGWGSNKRLLATLFLFF